jgi:hypothetical protein
MSNPWTLIWKSLHTRVGTLNKPCLFDSGPHLLSVEGLTLYESVNLSRWRPPARVSAARGSRSFPALALQQSLSLRFKAAEASSYESLALRGSCRFPSQGPQQVRLARSRGNRQSCRPMQRRSSIVCGHVLPSRQMHQVLGWCQVPGLGLCPSALIPDSLVTLRASRWQLGCKLSSLVQKYHFLRSIFSLRKAEQDPMHWSKFLATASGAYYANKPCLLIKLPWTKPIIIITGINTLSKVHTAAVAGGGPRDGAPALRRHRQHRQRQRQLHPPLCGCGRPTRMQCSCTAHGRFSIPLEQ